MSARVVPRSVEAVFNSGILLCWIAQSVSGPTETAPGATEIAGVKQGSIDES